MQESTLLTAKLYSCVVDTQKTIRKNLLKRRLSGLLHLLLKRRLSRLLHLLLSQLHLLLLERERLRLQRLLLHPQLQLLLLDRRLWIPRTIKQ